MFIYKYFNHASYGSMVSMSFAFQQYNVSVSKVFFSSFYRIFNSTPMFLTVNIGWWKVSRMWCYYFWFLSSVNLPVIEECYFWGYWWFLLSSTLNWTAAYTLTCSIFNDLLSKLFPCVLIKVLRIPLTVLICLSQTTPMWLSVGGFLIQVIQSTPCICQYSFLLLWFMS